MKVAVIGCGKQGLRHGEAFRRVREVTGLVVADPDRVRAEAASARFGAVCAPSVDAVFDDPEIALVVIAAPTQHHLPLARRALAARKHLLCEKPFGDDAVAAENLAREAAARGLVGRLGYLYRFAPAIAAARDAIPECGEIDTVRLTIAAAGNHASWKHRRDSGGGAINELASHMVDLALWCFGPMRDCAVLERARMWDRRAIGGVAVPADAEDRIVARLIGRGGVRVTIEADFAAPGFAQSLEIRGADRTIRASIAGSPDLYRLQARAVVDAVGGVAGDRACDLAAGAAARTLLDCMARAPVAAARA